MQGRGGLSGLSALHSGISAKAECKANEGRQTPVMDLATLRPSPQRMPAVVMAALRPAFKEGKSKLPSGSLGSAGLACLQHEELFLGREQEPSRTYNLLLLFLFNWGLRVCTAFQTPECGSLHLHLVAHSCQLQGIRALFTHTHMHIINKDDYYCQWSQGYNPDPYTC